VLVATIAGFFGRFWWVFDLLSHFRVQYFIAAAASAGVSFFTGQRLAGVLFGSAAVVNLALVAPYVVPSFGDEPRDAIRVGLINLDVSNREVQLVLNELERAEPDVVVLLEYTSRWAEELQDVEGFDHVIASPEESPFGIAIISNRPPTEFEEFRLVEDAGPTLRVRFAVSGRELEILALHLFPPIRAGGTAMRDNQLRAAAEFVRSNDVPTLVVGDLNSSYWSHGFRLLTARTDLRSAAKGRGIKGTWPSDIFVLRIPIDHVLVSGSIEVGSFERGRFVGSDHFPVWADVGWARE